MKTSTRKKPGAPEGNWNAFKHGFYSKRFRPLELSDLDTALGDGLEDEIALLRVIIRRVFECANDEENKILINGAERSTPWALLLPDWLP